MKLCNKVFGAAVFTLAWGLTPAAANEVNDASVLESSLTPGIGQGDFEFYVDVAGIRRAAEGRTITRVLVQLPARSILDQTDANAADLRIRALVYDGEHAVRWLRETAALQAQQSEDSTAREDAARADQQVQDVLRNFGGVDAMEQSETRVRLEADDRSAIQDTDYKLAELALEVPPGDYVVEVVIENLSKTKRGLLDRLRNRHLAATSRVLLRVPDLAATPSIADPIFRAGHNVRQDYASRVYGLLNDSLHVHTTVYGQGETRLDLTARDRAGEVHWTDSLLVDVEGSADVEFNASVNTLPAGQYILTLSATASEVVVTSRRSFDVAWSLSSWRKSRRDLNLEAEIVLSGREFDTFGDLPLGEQERFMDGFWANQDPTPDTAYNEVLQEFHRRVAFADVTYSESVRGALTDRGKIYIRFGPADDVQAEALSSHLAGEGAEGLIEQVEDPFSPSDEIIHGFPGSGTFVTGEASAAEATRLNREHDRVVGQARELMAYELWTYTGSGTPLLERDVLGIDTGFRVLFIDTQGFGQYELRKSSVTFDIPGLRPSF